MHKQTLMLKHHTALSRVFVRPGTLEPLLGYLNLCSGYFIMLLLEIYSLSLKLNNKNCFPHSHFFVPHFDTECVIE